MDKYYTEIEHIIKRNEINKRTRQIEDNHDTLNNYWNIGRLIVEAQGGKTKAKYGNELIKKWSEKLSELYGKGYNATNLKQFRQFYLTFPISRSLSDLLNWTQIRYILPIKDENKRNFYINLCIEQNLSSRELIKEIKSNSYERLINKPDKIEIITPKQEMTLTSNIRNPIIVYLKENEKVENHKDLELILLSDLQAFFRQLGNGYALIGNEYKITLGDENYYIDLLLFNIDFNSYVVVELKTRELKKEDKAQIKFYMEYIDNNLKKSYHNKTIGIIISKSHDRFIATFVSEEDIIPITYEIKMEESK